MQRRPVRFLVAATVVAVVGGACSGGSDGADAEPAAATTTTATAASTTTTAAPITTPTRVEQVLAQLLTLRNQIFSSPDPGRVGEYAQPECPCAEEDRKSLQALAERFEHWDSAQLELRGARVATRSGPDSVILEAVVGRPPERVVNRSGSLIRGQGEGLPDFPARFVIGRRDGTWRLLEVGSLELPPDVVAAIAAGGVPSDPPDDASRL